MEYKDYYKILGLPKNATDAQIKKEYRKAARKYHPDVSKAANAEQKFKEVGEAYEVLKDPEKRKAYDQYGADWKTGKQQQEYQKQYQGSGFGDRMDLTLVVDLAVAEITVNFLNLCLEEVQEDDQEDDQENKKVRM